MRAYGEERAIGTTTVLVVVLAVVALLMTVAPLTGTAGGKSIELSRPSSGTASSLTNTTVVAQLYPGAFAVYGVASLKTTALLILVTPSWNYEVVLFNVATLSTRLVQTYFSGSTISPVGEVAAGGVFWLAWTNATSGKEFWEKITSGGKLTYPSLPLGKSLSWRPISGSSTVFFATIDRYLVEINATSGKILANYSKSLPKDQIVSAVLQIGNLLYIGGARTITNEGSYPYFGYLNLTTKSLTTVSKTFKSYPSDVSSGFDDLIAEGSGQGTTIYVGGDYETIHYPIYSTQQGYFYRFVPSTSTFTNLSSILPAKNWTVLALEPWGSTIALSLNSYNASALATSLAGFEGGVYTLTNGSSLTSQASLFPYGYMPYAYEVTSESAGWYFSGGANMISGVAEVVAVQV